MGFFRAYSLRWDRLPISPICVLRPKRRCSSIRDDFDDRLDRTKAYREEMPSVAVIVPPSVGHIMGEIFLTDMMKILDQLAESVYLIATCRPIVDSNSNLHLIQMTGYRLDDPLLAKGIKFFLIELKSCFHLLRVSKNIDVVLFHMGSGLYLLPLVVAKILRKRTIFSAAGLYSKIASPRYDGIGLGIGSMAIRCIFKVLDSITVRLADQIVVESESVIASLGLEQYRDKISVTHFRVINTDEFIARKSIDERRLVGYIGRLGGEKGVMNLAKAIPLILERRNNLEFVIGGGGVLLDEMKNELKRTGSFGRTTFTDWVPHDDIPQLLNSLRLLVLPSYTEGLPGIVLEAMACSTLVLATPVGGVPDLVRDGNTGFIMENNSPECIAQNVIRALDHPNPAEIASNARALVEREFTYQMAVERYKKIVTNMIGN